MYVIKRSGQEAKVEFDKITARINKMCYGLDKVHVDSAEIAQKVISGLSKGITTKELDNLAAETAACMTTKHPDYAILAARIAVSNLHKETPKQFSEVIEQLYHYINPRTGKAGPMIADDVYAIVMANKDVLNSTIIHDRDFNYNYFGFKTLEKSYLLKMNGKIAERPSHMLMRVAIGIHKNDIDAAIETYHMLSQKVFTHATPTLFNAGTPKPSLSSCYLLSMQSDSIDGIYSTLKQCALISKNAGGIGLHVHDIRAAGSYIAGTNGTSNGLVPMLRCFNNTARYVDQCFLPETIVYTRDGPKMFKDVTTSDQVLNAKGDFDEIRQILKHDVSGKMLQFSSKVSQNFAPTQVTDMHQVLILRAPQQEYSRFDIKERLMAGTLTAQWLNAKDIQVGDYVCFPTPITDSSDDLQLFELDDLRLYGLMIASNCQMDDVTCSVYVYYEPLQKFLEEYLNARGIQFSKDDEEFFYSKYTWSSSALYFKFSKRQVSDNEDVKIIDPAIMRLPKQKLLAFVQGLCEGDGRFSANQDECWFQTMSPKVFSAVQWVLLKCGIMVTSASHEPIGGTNKHCYTLKFHRSLQETDGEQFECDGMLYRRINKVTEVEYAGTLYDFELFGDHTYVTSLGIVHNGGNKRPGAFAIYLEVSHADIFEFLDLRKNHGKEEMRARDLFYALWVPDLFMKRLEARENWTLMCPNECPGLSDVYGEEYEALYTKYENEGKGRRSVPATTLWTAILESQIETGNPFVLYKDAVNRKTNHQNLGVVKSSNLCTEIVQYSSPEEIAVCNLASLSLPHFVCSKEQYKDKSSFDFDGLMKTTQVLVRNLNKVIDVNFYAVPEAERSNMRHRPMAIGVQGLADVFMKLRHPFTSSEAKHLNKQIFETIYYGAVKASIELAKEQGVYPSYFENGGCPMSHGILQPDMWGIEQDAYTTKDLWDWQQLRADLKEYGVRNSLLVGLMPTASTAQILGNNESFEPIASNIYLRRVLSGEFQIVNQYLLKDLINLGLWDDDLKHDLIASGGSVQHIDRVPDDIKALYKTVWEISQKDLIEMAADRGAFVDQTQSMNIHLAEPTFGKLTSMHFYSWKKGQKTSTYYLRSKPAVEAIAFTVDPSKKARKTATATTKEATPDDTKSEDNQASLMCSLTDPSGCLSCQ